jgi:hypothetical protein
MVTVPLSDVRPSPQEADHDSRAFDLPNAFDEVASVEDETSEPPLDIRERRPSAAFRSAQGSSERDSTSDSDSVDWEKLARTEEREPRTGPTDEVCKTDALSGDYPGSWELISSSLPRCCWLVWNKRTMRW